MKKTTDRLFRPIFPAAVLAGGKIPFLAIDGARGFDIPVRAVVDLAWEKANPRVRKTIHDLKKKPYILQRGKTIRLGTGVAIELPKAYRGFGVASFVKPRGSAIKNEIAILDCSVPVDYGFGSEAVLTVRNDGKKPFAIHHHQRLAQYMFFPVIMPRFKSVAVGKLNKLHGFARGNHSHGFTGT